MEKSNPFSFSIEKKKTYHVITLSYSPTNHRRGITASVAPELGSNLFSLTFGGDDIIISDKKLLEQCGFTGNFPLFPTPNRVRDFVYTWGKKRYTMKKRGKTVLIHGLVFNEPWKFTKPKVSERGVTFKTSIEISKTSPLFTAFPFPCTLSLEYKLYAKGIKVTYTVKNNGSSDLPFGFALHPYFARLSGSDKTMISVPARSWMESPKTTLLPTGRLIPVAGKPYDLTRPRPLSSLNLDHVFTGFKPKSNAYIDYKRQSVRVTLKASADFTHAVVYTGSPDAVCIENQTCSTDAHNLWAKGFKKESHLLTIKPKRTRNGFVAYEVTSY